jgi:hypothetical protein
MVSVPYSQKKLSEVPSWIFLVVGLVVGQSSSPFTMPLLQWFQAGVESVLVPAYTLAVLLYLTVVAYSKHFQPFLLQREKRKSRAIRPALPVSIPKVQVPSLLEEDEEPQPIDLTGAYKLISNDGFEKILEVQGVPWPLRRYAKAEIENEYTICAR